MKIAVVGTGYVGLVTGTCLAESGNDVICVDIDSAKVARMRAGEIPIYEPHLDVYFNRNLKLGRLHFTENLAEAVSQSDLILLALPTPPGADGSADMRAVLKVAEDLGHMMDRYRIVVGKSTVPVGTGDRVRELIAKNAKADFDVIANPEFLREGHAVEDFMKPDRIVIGMDDNQNSEKVRTVLTELYAPFVNEGSQILFMDLRSAELTKYAANAFLATKISFMNEIAQLCERVGANVDNVRIGIGSDERIGNRFLFPGIGFGGSCFPKDVQALVKSSGDVQYAFRILNAVMQVNQNQREYFLEKILSGEGGNVEGKTLAVWGLAFKPDTDDIREAPALYLIEELLKREVRLQVFDPEAMSNVKKIYKDALVYCDTPYDAVEGADALIIATEWSLFRNPDLELLGQKMKHKRIYDGRNVFSVERMKKLGFAYYSVGRPQVN